jgi:hypothetical protein
MVFRKEPFFYGHDNYDQLVKIAKVRPRRRRPRAARARQALLAHTLDKQRQCKWAGCKWGRVRDKVYGRVRCVVG